MNNYSIL